VERVGQQRRAQHIAHLHAAHAGSHQRQLLLGDDIALNDVDAIRGDETQQAAVGRHCRAAAEGNTDQRRDDGGLAGSDRWQTWHG